jgi:hypothetical protein
MSRHNKFPSMPFIFSGLAFVIVFATAASNLTARSASRSYPWRFSFIFCMECYADAGGGEKHATLAISHIFFAISVADFKFSPTTGTDCTTEPRISSAVMA